LDEIGFEVYEEMLFKVKVYGRTLDGQTPDAKKSQKLTMSLCDRGAKKNCFQNYALCLITAP
jgi:hypothetical protein